MAKLPFPSSTSIGLANRSSPLYIEFPSFLMTSPGPEDRSPRTSHSALLIFYCLFVSLVNFPDRSTSQLRTSRMEVDPQRILVLYIFTRENSLSLIWFQIGSSSSSPDLRHIWVYVFEPLQSFSFLTARSMTSVTWYILHTFQSTIISAIRWWWGASVQMQICAPYVPVWSRPGLLWWPFCHLEFRCANTFAPFFVTAAFLELWEKGAQSRINSTSNVINISSASVTMKLILVYNSVRFSTSLIVKSGRGYGIIY